LASGFSLVSSRLPLPPPPPPGLGFPMPRTLASSVGRRGGCWEGRSTGGASASGAPYRRQRAGRGGRPAVPQLRVLRTGVRGGSGGVRYCTASLLASPPIVAAAAAARFGVSMARTLASSVGRRGGCWEGRSTGGASASGSLYRRRRGSDGGVRYRAASLLASFFTGLFCWDVPMRLFYVWLPGLFSWDVPTAYALAGACSMFG
jgi:hypothetical protein